MDSHQFRKLGCRTSSAPLQTAVIAQLDVVGNLSV